MLIQQQGFLFVSLRYQQCVVQLPLNCWLILLHRHSTYTAKASNSQSKGQSSVFNPLYTYSWKSPQRERYTKLSPGLTPSYQAGNHLFCPLPKYPLSWYFYLSRFWWNLKDKKYQGLYNMWLLLWRGLIILWLFTYYIFRDIWWLWIAQVWVEVISQICHKWDFQALACLQM